MEAWKDPLTPIIWLFTGIILLLLFAGFIFLLIRSYIRRIKLEAEKKHALLVQHQKELLENTIKSEEKEKKRIALQLHDDLLAQLHRIKIMNNDQEIGSLLSGSIKQIRQISHDLLPSFLEGVPFIDVLQNFLGRFEPKYQISIHAHAVSEKAISLDKKLQLFRIFQELVVNCIKHAEANKINLNWRKTDTYCCLIFSDNGLGMDPNLKQGLGLKNIETRAKVIEGEFKFKLPKKEGTTFIMIVPL
jgi:two-component system NarL family sensor kinase